MQKQRQKRPAGESQPFEMWLAKWAFIGIGGLLGLSLLVYLLGVVGFLLLVFAGVALTGMILWHKHQDKPKANIPAQDRPRATATVSVQTRSHATSESEQHQEPAVTASPRFHGRHEIVQFQVGSCADPLTYICRGRVSTAFDPSLIELGLPVNLGEAATAPPLPYWPSYGEATPGQRAAYQQWLVNRRKDPRIAIGYVFIYFYGLERRILVDGQDHRAIVREVIRLLRIYGGTSGSFRRYATSFLWHVIRRGMADARLCEKVLPFAVRMDGRWDDESLQLCLSMLHDLQQPVPGELALRIAEQDGRSIHSAIIGRHRQKFNELFIKRYRHQYDGGMMLRSSVRPTRIRYQPASAMLARRDGAALEVDVANCLAITSQFKPLVELWGECIEEMRSYDRVARHEDDTQHLTAEAYEKLPEELRTGDHPEFTTWWAVKEKYADENGWSIVPIAALAEIKGFNCESILHKSQCEALLNSADTMGFGIEPDARITQRSYRGNEFVSLFVLEHDEQPSGRYLAAATMLRLGMVIAEADGSLDDVELRVIADHLERQFDLSDIETERLKYLRYLLSHKGARADLIVKRLRDSLSQAQRASVGAYLVSIAAADGTVTDAEMKALKKLYRQLKLDISELDLLTQPAQAGTEVPEIQPHRTGQAGQRIPARRSAFALDFTRIQQTQRETAEVAAILIEAMAVDGDEDDDITDTSEQIEVESDQDTVQSEEASAVSTVAITTEHDDSLPARLRPFLDILLQREQWPTQDLRALADEHSLMLAGAIDELNEWAETNFGDRLIDDDSGGYSVDVSLVKEAL